MAKPEKKQNNEKLVTLLVRTTFNGLSSEARQVITETIQGCDFLGKYKLPEKDIYYIIRHCPELSLVGVTHHLNLHRVNNNEKTVKGSSIEKYKRACTLVVVALEAFIDEGGQIDGLKKVLPAKPLTDAQKAHCQELLGKGGISAVELMAYLQTVK